MESKKQVYNFSAGPAMIPKEVKKELADSIIDYQGSGVSVAELSHRSKQYKDEIFPETQQAFRELLAIPDDFYTLFISGGASFEFSNIPRNLLGNHPSVDYINTGSWSKKAEDVATKMESEGLIGKVHSIIGTRESNGLKKISPFLSDNFDQNSAYIHITANETIGGIQYNQFPHNEHVPLVADMSSELFTRKFDATDFGMFYACGQKNFGQSAISFVAVKKELLTQVMPGTADVQNYRKVAESDSALNTPSTVGVYLAGLIAKYIQKEGGVPKMAAQAAERSGLIYSVIDNSDGFYTSPVNPLNRSKTNIPFLLPTDLESTFKHEAESEGLTTLSGHRSVGGLRASMYVGMPLAGAKALADFLGHFEHKYKEK